MCWRLIGPWQIIAVQPLNKKFECFFNYKLHVRTGLLDPEKMGKDTKSEYLAHLAQKVISLFAYMTEKLLKGAGVAFSDSHSYYISRK